MYRNFVKRLCGFFISLCAFLCLFPFFVLLMVIGIIKMKGNPFFTQERLGKDEKIFKLIKFRTMTQERDSKGVLLPDEKRLTAYGHFLRSTSLDELPELLNIIKGDMAFVGPRPLLVRYQPFYTEKEHHRHDVRPGLTGLAQVKGRNFMSWEERFACDLEYIQNISLKNDLYIFFMTVQVVLKRKGIGDAEEGECKKDKDGNYWSLYKGQWYRIYLPLDEERKEGIEE